MKRRKRVKRVKRTTRTNPEILAILNPAGVDELEKAKRAYKKFHGVAPSRVVVRGRRGKRPRKVLIVLGRLIDLIYEPRRGQRKRIHWIHAFGPEVRLATDSTGRELFILGPEGVRQVDFSRGIVS